MITANDIENVGNNTLAYMDGEFCIQFDTFEVLSEKEIQDAKTQFALILSISDRDKEDIENHMRINGFSGVASCYRV